MPTNEKSKSEERRIAIQKEAEARAEAEAQAGDAPEAAPTGASTPASEPESSTPRVKEEDEVVEVSKVDLKNFMKRMEELEESNRKLLAVADKGRMFQFSEKERAENSKIPTVKLTRIGSPAGKLVLAWKMGKNESYVDGSRLIEHQTINVFYQDGTAEEMPLLEFYRQQNKDTVGKVKARTTNDDGSESLRIELRDGELVEIGLKFVN